MAADDSRALIRGHAPFVVTVEISLAGKSALQAEATILHMLEWVKENYSADFNLYNWQATGVEEGFSRLALSCGADALPPDAVRPRLIGEATETPNG